VPDKYSAINFCWLRAAIPSFRKTNSRYLCCLTWHSWSFCYTRHGLMKRLGSCSPRIDARKFAFHRFINLVLGRSLCHWYGNVSVGSFKFPRSLWPSFVVPPLKWFWTRVPSTAAHNSATWLTGWRSLDVTDRFVYVQSWQLCVLVWDGLTAEIEFYAV